MPCRATQDRRVMMKSSDKTWSAGEGNGKPLRYSCLENPTNRGRGQNEVLENEGIHIITCKLVQDTYTVYFYSMDAFFFITVESLSIESCLIWLYIPRAQHISWHITVTKQLLDEWMKDRKSMKKILILEMIAFAESIQWWEVIVSKLISSRKVKTNKKQNQQRPPKS